MKKWTKEDVIKNIRENNPGYGSMVVIGYLFKKIYGELPKIGLSGQQAEFINSVEFKED